MAAKLRVSQDALNRCAVHSVLREQSRLVNSFSFFDCGYCMFN